MINAYYNEIDPFAAQWLKNLIKGGLIPKGEVDERSIIDVAPDDLRGFTQAHFFAGIGGWSYAARLAGWPDDKPIWTGSCPCQPFSVAGTQGGQKDERHLWPVFFQLIKSCRPDVVMGEQVAAAVGKSWFDGVFNDLEGIDYAAGSVVVPACAVNAPHRRDRLWFVANPVIEGWQGRLSGRSDQERETVERHVGCDGTTHWSGASWIGGADGKQRRFEPRIRLLADGVPARVGKLRAYGNAIVPQVAAEIMKAYLDIYS
jgi:DNA (cytosine-5)-methyltransferase 1